MELGGKKKHTHTERERVKNIFRHLLCCLFLKDIYIFLMNRSVKVIVRIINLVNNLKKKFIK